MKGKRCYISLSGSTPSFTENDIIEINNLQIDSIIPQKKDFLDYNEHLYTSERIFIKGIANVADVKQTGRTTFNINNIFKKFKNNISSFFNIYMSDDSADFMSSITTGVKNDENKELYKILRINGLSHVVVVSGMHFSIIIAYILLFLRKYRINIKQASFIALLSAIIIAFFFGFTPSVIRALIMNVSVLAADILERDKSNKLHILIITALAMLLYNPFLLYNASFILSFLSVYGIRTLSDKLTIKSGYIPEFIRESIAVSLSANIFTFPFVVFFFSEISLIFLFGNLIVTPILPFIMIYGYFNYAISLFSYSLAGIAIIPLNLMLVFIIKILNAAAQIPISVVKFPPPKMYFIIIYYIAIIILFIDIKRKYLKIIISFILIIILLLIILLPEITGNGKMYIIDGKESGKVILTSKGETVVIDLSSDSNEKNIKNILNKHALNEIDYYFINNKYSLDALTKLAHEINIKNIFYSNCIDEDKNLLAKLNGIKSEIYLIKYNKIIKIGNILLTPAGDRNYNIREIIIESKTNKYCISSDLESLLNNEYIYIFTYNKYKFLVNNNLLPKNNYIDNFNKIIVAENL